jgi:hypothetical protein
MNKKQERAIRSTRKRCIEAREDARDRGLGSAIFFHKHVGPTVARFHGVRDAFGDVAELIHAPTSAAERAELEEDLDEEEEEEDEAERRLRAKRERQRDLARDGA